MKKGLIFLGVLIVLGAAGYYLWISGRLAPVAAVAQPGQTAEPTVPPVVAGNQILSEGELVPGQSVNLSFNTGGLVDEVLVAEGDQVETGQPLARLRNLEQLKAAVAQANLELVNARIALEDLTDHLDQQAAAAQKAAADAQKAVEDAERYLTNVQSSGDPADIDAARAQVIIARDRLDKARKDYRPYEKKAEDNLIRAALLAQLSDAQKNYDRLVERLNNLEGTASQTTVSQAEADLAVAQANLAQAQKDYEMYQQGPDPDALAAAQARVANAEAQLAAAQAAQDDLEIEAPFNGTVITLNLKAGEFISPGVPVLILADLSTWKVETTDLTELDVVRIAPGDPAIVAFDALPGEELPARVDKIQSIGENRQGDIVYTVEVVPDPADAWAAFQEVLRWKMTASVTIEPEG